MCLCVCMCIHMCVYTYIYIFMCISVYASVCLCVFACLCAHVCISVCAHVHVHGSQETTLASFRIRSSGTVHLLFCFEFEMRSLIGVELTNWWNWCNWFQNLPFSASPVLGSQACAKKPGCLCVFNFVWECYTCTCVFWSDHSTLMYPFKNSPSAADLIMCTPYVHTTPLHVLARSGPITFRKHHSHLTFFKDMNSWELHLSMPMLGWKVLTDSTKSPSLIFRVLPANICLIREKKAPPKVKHGEEVLLFAQPFLCDGASVRHTSVGVKSKPVWSCWWQRYSPPLCHDTEENLVTRSWWGTVLEN